MSDQSPDPRSSRSASSADDSEVVEAEVVEEDVRPAPEQEPEEIVVEAEPTPSGADAAAGAAGAEKVVYVTAPAGPRVRSNRIVGVVLALVGTIVFALILAVVGALIASGVSDPLFGPVFLRFVRDAAFWLPVLFFTLAFVLVVLLLNRAAWWLHVVGSLLVAVIVYFGTIGVLLLIQPGAAFAVLASSPFTIAAALIAREVSMWVGFLIAARGQRVRRRNLQARETFDQEQSDKGSAGAGARTA